MIKFALRKWNENEDILEQHIRKDRSLNLCEYEYLVKLVVRYIFNGGIEEWETKYDENNSYLSWNERITDRRAIVARR